MSGLVVDLFAGGGGASVGLEAALGRRVDLAINRAATTKSAKVRLIGNSVCPEVAEAIVRSNVPAAASLEAVS